MQEIQLQEMDSFQNELLLKAKILSKTLWSNTDIMDFVGCKKTIASQIHRIAAIEFDGVVKVFPRMVKRDSVLRYLGLDLIKEVSIVRSMLLEKTKEKNNENCQSGN